MVLPIDLRIHDFAIDARDHGAKGDGVNDDYPAVVAALNKSVQAETYLVTLPVGTFRLSSALAVPAGCILRGSGHGLTVLKPAGALLTSLGAGAKLENLSVYGDSDRYAGETPISVKLFGAVGDGSTDDTSAFTSAAAVGVPIYIPHGTYKITGPVTISNDVYGAGTDDGQSTVLLVGATAQLLTGDTDCHWSGFRVESATNDVTMVKVAHSYFHFDNFALQASSPYSATGQIGIEFATGSGLFHCSLYAFRLLHLNYPVKITGTGPFNNNHLGRAGDSWNTFVTAIGIYTTSAFAANHVGGYFETGTKIVHNESATAVYANVFDLINDTVTTTLHTEVDIDDADPNIWIIPRDAVLFTTAGGKTIIPQRIISRVAAFRVYLANDQTIADATSVKVAWDTEVLDTLSAFDSATNRRYTAPYAQRLRVYAQVEISGNVSAGSRLDLFLKKNGSTDLAADKVFSQGTNGGVVRLSDVVTLAAGDYLEVFAKGAGSGSHTVTGATTLSFFCGEEL